MSKLQNNIKKEGKKEYWRVRYVSASAFVPNYIQHFCIKVKSLPCYVVRIVELEAVQENKKKRNCLTIA